MNVGARLRQARESRGLSREALVRATRIPMGALAAIEDNNVTRLPPHPYNKGFVEAYAREVGLEPHSTAREFLDQFVIEPPPAPVEHQRDSPEYVIEGRPRRVAWLAVPAAALVWFMMSGRGSTPDGAAVNPGVPPRAEPVAPAARDEAAPARDVAPASGPVEHAGAISLVLRTSAEAWVEARADGQRVVYELLDPGVERRIGAEREIAMRIGDAGAVSLVVNGRSLGPLGASGQVRELRVTPDGLR